MIITNGTMQEVVMKGGGIINGTPQPSSRSYSESIPVNISGNMARNNKTENGTSFASATYEILCEETDFTAEEVVLINNRGRNMGTFKVKDISYLDCVDAIKIIVERYGE